MGPAAAEAFDRLNRASVALLQPLLDPQLAERPRETAALLSDAISNCAQVADAQGLRGLNYLATLLVPYLQRHASDEEWPRTRALLEAWVGDVVAFCAGHLDAGGAPQLVLGLLEWPDFPSVPGQFVTLISGRLRQDAIAIAALARELIDEPAASAAAAPAREPPNEPATEAEPTRSGAGVSQADLERPGPHAARDEFDMLAEAVLQMRADLEAAGAADADAASDAVEQCVEQLGNVANALGFLGVEPLAEVVRRMRDGASAGRGGGDVAVPACLEEGLLALGEYLREPSPERAEALARAVADARWPSALPPERVQPLARWLGAVRLVESRQVGPAVQEIGGDDLSLEVPTDADARVVDHLLRELPALCARFGRHVDRAAAGSRDDLEEARRIAHTLKGSANTVGIRGVATLTHLLEDLLQLLGRGEAPPPPGLAEALLQAADCLGEMTDAVAGLGAAPQDAEQVCRELAGWIGRLLPGAEAEAAPAGADAGAPTAAAGSADAPPAPSAREAPLAAADAVTPLADAVPPSPGGEVIRVPADLVDRMLELAGEAAILLAQAQEQLGRMGETRGAVRSGNERLLGLAADLERLVDVRGVSLTGRRSRGEFDALELDEFNELHTVSRRIAEAADDAKLLDQQSDRQSHALAESVGQLERVQADLRESVMRSRMVHVSSVAPRLHRAVRQASRMAGRSAELEVRGEHTAVDGHLLQALVDPLTHLLRNAVDHGVESPGERAAAGKPPAGRIVVDFSVEGRMLTVGCADDGRGLDFAAIRERAVESGLLAADAVASDAELARMILLPGFSTKRAATQLSGRGIGLDVVQRAVHALRGTLRVDSAPGGGTRIAIRVPQRMAAVPVAVVRAGRHVLALAIRGVEQVMPADGIVVDEAGVSRLVVRDGFVPVERLDELLGLPAGHFVREAALERESGAGARDRPPLAEVALIVRGDDGAEVGVIAPEPGQTRSVVVRPLPAWLPRIDAIEGATVLGDGAVAPVIDLPMLLSGPQPSIAVPVAKLPARRAPVCLVVDDSVSVRRSMEAFLGDLGFEVDPAADGVEALARIERRVPDLAIVDLEMPRMNGVEFTSALRHDERTVEVPVIMITSRYSEKHRAMALDAGVDVFLTKPYTEDELARHVRRCLERRSALG